jgi:arylsulfatase A-like enzyme
MMRFTNMQKGACRISKIVPIVTVAIFLFSCRNSNDTSSVNRNQPNILVIFMDDMGYGDLNSYGAIDYKTTNLNELADQGMRFTNFYAAQAVCSASRAGLLTGCYPNRVGIHGALFPGQKTGLSTSEQTIADILKQQDYATGMIGKWHLGDTIPCLPLQHGFDEYFGIPYSNDMWPVKYDGTPAGPDDFQSHFPPLPILEGNKPVRYIRNLEDMSMVTTLYTERAIDFIKRHRDHPFFLYLAESMVHVPIAASEKFRGKSKQGLFGDVMEEVDYSIGQILNALKENGLENNTLVVFTSDNGPWLNFGNHAGSSGGLREGKGTSWEGGQREDCIMRWPGVIPAGTICEKLSSTIDLLPTFANITQAPLPKNKIDGVNILPLLKGEDVTPRDHFYYYYQVNSLEAVREGHWKLVFPHDFRSYEGVMPGHDGFPGGFSKGHSELALYDLRRDPGEHYDVKEMFPEVVKQLEALGDQARRDLGDDLTGMEGANRRQPESIRGREHNKAPWEK